MSPSSFLITNTNLLNNHLKLDLIINGENLKSVDIAAEILASRHLKSNKDKYDFIKDTLTFNF